LAPPLSSMFTIPQLMYAEIDDVKWQITQNLFLAFEHVDD